MSKNNPVQVELNDNYQNKVTMQTSVGEYKEDMESLLEANRELKDEDKKDDNNPFIRYPELMEAYATALEDWIILVHDMASDADIAEMAEGEKEFFKMHYFCIYMENDQLGNAAGEYFKMPKEYRLLVPDDIVETLKENGKFDHFKN